MAGEHDLVVPIKGDRQVCDWVSRCIGNVWPQACVELLFGCTWVDAVDLISLFPVQFFNEALYYRDRKSFYSWNDKQSSSVLLDDDDCLIHVLIRENDVTLVTDAEGSETYKIAQDIGQSLLANPMFIKSSM